MKTQEALSIIQSNERFRPETILKAARSLAYEIDRLTGKDDHPEHRVVCRQ